MIEEFKDAPETARGGAYKRKNTFGTKPHHNHPPETAGTRANGVQKPTREERASEHPAFGPGDDAIAGQIPMPCEHHPEQPATAGEVGQYRKEAHGHQACLHNSPGARMSAESQACPGAGGAVGQSRKEAQGLLADREKSPGDGGGDGPGTKSEPLAESPSPTASPKGEARAPSDLRDPENRSARATKSPRKGGQIDGNHPEEDAQVTIVPLDLRFTDPLVAEIVQLHRMRRRWMKAKNALILQGKAFGRAVCDGDKDAGTAAYERVMKGKARPGDEALAGALVPFAAAIEHFDQSIRPIERHLERLAKRLPIAPWVATVTGLGWGSVAAIVGEAGDLSQYPSVAGVWKRMGLAVIDGDGRQRKVAGAEAAAAHGYNPERRSVVWVMADSMAKLQRTWLDKETGEVRKAPGPYGEILEREKDKALSAGLTKAHAEARGKRHMSKAVLRDMTLEWRRAVGHRLQETQRIIADRPYFPVAAE